MSLNTHYTQPQSPDHGTIPHQGTTANTNILAYAVIEPLQPTAQQPKVSAVIGLLAVFTFMIHVNFI